jgi:putative DNA primase/helicase
MEKFVIGVGTSRHSTYWKNQIFTWLEFCKKFENPTVTKETLAEYQAMIPAQKANIKDVGGFIGGYCTRGSRKIQNIQNRSLICLDLDNNACIPDVPYRAIIHSTHSHTVDNSRYRIIIPLEESITSLEYEFVSRWMAKTLGCTESADKTTYQANRLMYWPSCCIDAEKDYVIKILEGETFSGKKLLENNPGWESTILEVSDTSLQEIKSQILRKQADPLAKNGVIGAFCKAFTIQACIEKYIPNYEPTDIPTRYTWSGGSASGGVLIFDDMFSYSFHGTDPASMILCNCYDLVRLHLFKGNEKETLKWCAVQPGVSNQLAIEKFSEQDDFEIEDWHSQLEFDGHGKPKPTIKNFEIILDNTENLKYDEFKRIPMRGDTPYGNFDDAIIANMIESKYHVFNMGKLQAAISVVCHKNKFHPIKDYLNALPDWDGIPRVDKLLIDYFGADDNIFTREAIRKTLLSAVKRIYEPGCEVQHILVLRGAQELGKSYFFKTLCPEKGWFSDSLNMNDFTDTKKSGEQFAGQWILEIPEMQGMRKTEIQAIRSAITRDTDKYRPAFGRVLEAYPRQCIFVSTVNEAYLQDTAGNRRYWTILCKKSNRSAFDVDQIWAEVLMLYKKGESVKLSDEAKILAKLAEQQNIETDDRTSLIKDFIDMKLPVDWYNSSTWDRVAYLSDELGTTEEPTEFITRSTISTFEVWCECYGNPKHTLKRIESNALVKAFISLGFTEKTSKRDKNYGVVTSYKKPSK